MTRPRTTFEVYTHFGRVLSSHPYNPTRETHHRAAEAARKACYDFPGKAWVRQR